MVPKRSHDAAPGSDSGGRDAVEIPVETADGTITATPTEAAALRRTRVMADVLDEAVRVPGTNYRVGLDPILGVGEAHLRLDLGRDAEAEFVLAIRANLLAAE